MQRQLGALLLSKPVLQVLLFHLVVVCIQFRVCPHVSARSEPRVRFRVCVCAESRQAKVSACLVVLAGVCALSQASQTKKHGLFQESSINHKHEKAQLALVNKTKFQFIYFLYHMFNLFYPYYVFLFFLVLCSFIDEPVLL
jgi:hypothetical protein